MRRREDRRRRRTTPCRLRSWRLVHRSATAGETPRSGRGYALRTPGGAAVQTASEQRFGAAFEFARIWQFIKANIGNYLLAVVVYMIARFLAGFGIALLCIGLIFTGFWAFLITAHGFAQVYRLSKRGRATRRSLPQYSRPCRRSSPG